MKRTIGKGHQSEGVLYFYQYLHLHFANTVSAPHRPDPFLPRSSFGQIEEVNPKAFWFS